MTLSKAVIWRNADGSIQVTKFLLSAQLQSGLSEDDFIAAHMIRLQKPTLFGNKQYFIMDKSDLSTFFASIPESDHDRIVISDKGVLSVNQNKETAKDKSDALLGTIRAKLKTILTDTEIDFILRQ